MRRCLAALLVLVSATPVAAVGEEVRSQLMVTAHVPARASLVNLSRPTTFTISSDDVQRGYVDVGAVFRVSNNDPAGYVLRLAPRIGLTRAIEVTGLTGRVLVADDVVEVSQPAALRPQELRLNFRLLFDGSVGPGTYEVPVHVAVRAL